MSLYSFWLRLFACFVSFFFLGAHPAAFSPTSIVLDIVLRINSLHVVIVAVLCLVLANKFDLI